MFKKLLFVLILTLPLNVQAQGATTKGATTNGATTNGATTKSLFERLGGKESIRKVVDQFVVNVLADPSIQPFFAITANEPGRAEKLKNHLVDQICQATGGSCTYAGKDMKTAHAGMKITEAHFNSLVNALVSSLTQFKVQKKEQDELLGILGSLKSAIVENNKTK